MNDDEEHLFVRRLAVWADLADRYLRAEQLVEAEIRAIVLARLCRSAAFSKQTTTQNQQNTPNAKRKKKRESKASAAAAGQRATAQSPSAP